MTRAEFYAACFGLLRKARDAGIDEADAKAQFRYALRRIYR